MDQTIAKILEEGMADFHMRIKENIFRGEPPPNAPSTIEKKGFDAPLWETGGLFNEVSFSVEPTSIGLHGEAGILNDDTELHKIAMINELGSQTEPGHPPSRPAFRSAYDANSDRVLSKMEKDILNYLDSLI